MKNRIKKHVKIRAGDLVPHELNPKVHSDSQRATLRDLYDHIGFARSLLAYELPDGRLKLIDGHLRQSTAPDEVVDVEVLDVNDTEARALLLSIDPLAQLADYDNTQLDQLREITQTDSANLIALWESLRAADTRTGDAIDRAKSEHDSEPLPEKFLVLVECLTERHQVELLRRFKAEGMTCKAITS